MFCELARMPGLPCCFGQCLEGKDRAGWRVELVGTSKGYLPGFFTTPGVCPKKAGVDHPGFFGALPGTYIYKIQSLQRWVGIQALKNPLHCARLATTFRINLALYGAMAERPPILGNLGGPANPHAPISVSDAMVSNWALEV